MKKRDIKNKNILVTGGAGKIGSKLCEALLDLEANVICFDNFFSGKMDAINNLLAHPNFVVRGGDIRNIKDCKKAINKVDYVFHLAGVDYNSIAVTDVTTINEVNVVGFLNMLTASREANVKGMMYPTSCSQSFNEIELPKNEESIKGKSLSPYEISNYTNKLYASLFLNKYGFQIKGVECTPIFGKYKTTDISNIIQLNIDALEGMIKEEYILA
tara:strand:+ start:323 stop:967 length:645 start_codon:yes stop_codon:yes gene_type:complete